VADVPLAKSDYFRGVAKEARILTKNRYFEANPVLTDQQISLIARMGLRRFTYVGDGPIRGVYSQPGSFSDAAFVVSGDALWRLDTDGTKTFIGTISGANPRSPVSMAATSNIGTTPAFLFVCAGSTLYLYIESGYALGQINGVPVNGDVVRIGSVYYKFTNAGVDVGTPAGTLAFPWNVALGASTTIAWQNFAAAIGASGNPGVDYSTNLLTANVDVQVRGTDATYVAVRATALGALGNAIVTTETGAGIAWGAGTLTGGGAPTFTPVEMPDDLGVISLGYIASYVVVVPAQGQNVNGRFYWIEPGETAVDPINFATAERAPDPVNGVVVFGDQFWLPGTTTTEVWYFTGDVDAPVARTRGVVFDRGTWQGTGIQVKENMVIVDAEGGVFKISGGVQRISRPDIEERIRRAIQIQASRIF
jgi:hypothetical protein